MERALAALILLAGLGCRGSDLVGVEPSQIAVVIVDRVVYAPSGSVGGDRTIGPLYTRVSRRLDCSKGIWISPTTHVEEYCPLQDGESNFMEAGTAIHRIDGADPRDVLAYFDGYAAAWRVLVPVAQRCVEIRTTAGAVTAPDSGCGE